MTRRETGPMRAAPDDWTGLFIRGDEALGHAIALECVVLPLVRGNVLAEAEVAALIAELRTCKEATDDEA